MSRNLSASVTAACCSTLRNVRSGITNICLTRILLNVKTRKQSTRGGQIFKQKIRLLHRTLTSLHHSRKSAPAPWALRGDFSFFFFSRHWTRMCAVNYSCAWSRWMYLSAFHLQRKGVLGRGLAVCDEMKCVRALFGLQWHSVMPDCRRFKVAGVAQTQLKVCGGGNSLNIYKSFPLHWFPNSPLTLGCMV